MQSPIRYRKIKSQPIGWDLHNYIAQLHCTITYAQLHNYIVPYIVQEVQNDTWPLHCHINDPLWHVTIKLAANQKVKHHKTQDVLLRKFYKGISYFVLHSKHLNDLMNLPVIPHDADTCIVDLSVRLASRIWSPNLSESIQKGSGFSLT